jgi:uncharacterized membrane protein
VMICLGTATRLYPLLLFGALLVICWRDRRWRDFTVAVVSGAGAWLVANAPAYLSGADQWRVFWSFNAGRGPDWGSLWLLVAEPSGVWFSSTTINRWSWVLLVLWCVGVLLVGLAAPRTPTLAQLGFLIVAGFLLVNKIYSPQYVLWLLPLAVMARPRWRDLLIWQAGEVFYFAAIWWRLGGFLDPAGGGVAGFYLLAIVVRVLAELYLVGVVVRDILRPEARGVDAGGGGSGEDDGVEGRGGEPDPGLDRVADGGDARPAGQEEHRGLHVRRLGEETRTAVDEER